LEQVQVDYEMQIAKKNCVHCCTVHQAKVGLSCFMKKDFLAIEREENGITFML